MEIAFLVLALLGAWWYSGSVARDAAILAVRQACTRHGVQLLDETVAQVKLRLQRDRSGRVRLWRLYQFEFTGDGEQRRHGEVILLGRRVLALNLELDQGVMLDQGESL